MKDVLSNWDIGVHRSAQIVSVQPDRIHIVHPVLEANLLWPCERSGVEMQLHMMRSRRQNEFTTGGPRCSSNGDVFDEDRGFGSVAGQPPSIKHRQALYSCNPELIV